MSSWHFSEMRKVGLFGLSKMMPVPSMSGKEGRRNMTHSGFLDQEGQKRLFSENCKYSFSLSLSLSLSLFAGAVSSRQVLFEQHLQVHFSGCFVILFNLMQPFSLYSK